MIRRKPSLILTELAFTHHQNGSVVLDTKAIPLEKDEQICNAEVNFRRCLSEECQDLIRSCLRIRPQDRLDLGRVLQHPWLMEQETDSSGDQQPDISQTG